MEKKEDTQRVAVQKLREGTEQRGKFHFENFELPGTFRRRYETGCWKHRTETQERVVAVGVALEISRRLDAVVVTATKQINWPRKTI